VVLFPLAFVWVVVVLVWVIRASVNEPPAEGDVPARRWRPRRPSGAPDAPAELRRRLRRSRAAR
jgi:hypothetical protein